jgi:3-phenylpropionate/cinnamic acid dioxygenase small subunit
LSAELFYECTTFLYKEAELLDDAKLEEWLELTSDDIEYRIPVRVTKVRGETGISNNTFFLTEDKKALLTRVKRSRHQSAWAEEIPSRFRRFVSNIRVEPHDGTGQIHVKSNLLLFRAWGEPQQTTMISAERHDVLTRALNGRLNLRRREVILDHSTLPTHNLSMIL